MKAALPTVTIVYNTAFYVYKFRVNLIKRLQRKGFSVVVISPADEYVTKLLDLDVEHIDIAMSQYGMNPIKELATTWQLYTLLKRIRPVCSLHYTIKPNIFGSIAARLAGVALINNIAGAGRAFSDENSIIAKLVSALYKVGLKKSKKVFFQNNEDMKLFIETGLVSAAISERIPGSGVDIAAFKAEKRNESEGSFKFLFVGRLLKEKGIVEFLTAAQAVIMEHPDKNIRFECVGELDETTACITKDDLDSYLRHGSISYLGTVSPDMMPVILDSCDCVVLPSYYREGVPRSLLEAAAKGIPIITTDNVGCRDVVDNGVTGFIVPIRNALSVQEAMLKMFELSSDQLQVMGTQARAKIEREFDEEFVLEAYIRAIENDCNVTILE